MGWITGPNTDSYSRFGISGADLGIVWDNGQSGAGNQVLMAFGDTFGNCTVTDHEWRNNTLFRSSDRNLADGIMTPNPVPGNIYAGSPVDAGRPNFSRQVIRSLGLAATEVTIIPTAGISVGTTQYVNFMSVSQWGSAGQWSTNFAAVAVSNDNGETWTVPVTSIRPSWFNTVPGVAFTWGDQNFQMGAYLRSGGYVYSYGTGAGQVVWAPGSEMSVAWNDYLKKFVMLYTNTLSAVVMRTADKPEGPWSQAKTIVGSTAVPGASTRPTSTHGPVAATSTSRCHGGRTTA